MKTVTPLHAEHELARVAQRFDHWRQHRPTPRPRIPQALWNQAVALTAVLPISRVAKRLRLSTNDLKKHCGATPAMAVAQRASAALGFVEVSAAAVWPLPALHTEIDLQRADGARLRIQTHALPCPITALVQTFLETT